MYENEMNFAIKAARVAGDMLKKRDMISINFETGKDLKLSSDKLSEKLIIEILQPTGIPILSEECGYLGEDKNSFLWIIDPLDGTVNYLRGLIELCCISIALWKDNEPILGVVYRFALDELYCGIVGEYALLNGEHIRTSAIASVGKAVLATGLPVHRDYSSKALLEFTTQMQNFKKVRMLGAAAIMGVLVASGKVDAYIEDDIMLWDIAASSAIVLAAGGQVSINQKGDFKCVCRCFSTSGLKENYYAESL